MLILKMHHQTDLKLEVYLAYNTKINKCVLPGRLAQSETYLTADPGVTSSITSHTFVESDHEIFSTAILLPSAGCQLRAKVCAQSTG